jgi:transposase
MILEGRLHETPVGHLAPPSPGTASDHPALPVADELSGDHPWLSGGGLSRGLDHAEVLGVLVHHVLVSRGPMYRIREWARRIEPEALELTAAQVEQLNDDRLVRSLEALAGESGRSVFFRLALRVIKDFELELQRVHFDTTTVTFFGQYEASTTAPRITRGVNKDHRPDLKQLLFGLNVTSDGGGAPAAPHLQWQSHG